MGTIEQAEIAVCAIAQFLGLVLCVGVLVGSLGWVPVIAIVAATYFHTRCKINLKKLKDEDVI